MKKDILFINFIVFLYVELFSTVLFQRQVY